MSQGAPRNRPHPDGPRSDAPRSDAPSPDGARADAPRTGSRPDGGRGVRPSGGRSSGARPSGGGTGRRRRRVDGDAPRPTEGGGAIAPAPAPLPASAAATPPGQALERLRARVLDAVREIERLRVENDTLAARVAEMEVEAGREPVAIAPFGGDPEALRRQIEGFVEALDALLTDEDGADRPA